MRVNFFTLKAIHHQFRVPLVGAILAGLWVSTNVPAQTNLCECASPSTYLDDYWKPSPLQTTLEENPYRLSLFRPKHGEDAHRLWSQTKSVSILGFSVIGVLLALPEQHTGWEVESDILGKWKENMRNSPKWDRDQWTYNYVGHIYFGGVYYQVARKSGYRQWDAFCYSFLMSTFYWEYGIEAFAEVPSIQDIVVTPVMGWVYGEWAYRTEARIRNNNKQVLGSKLLGSAALVLLDPVDSIGTAINRITKHDLVSSGYGYLSYAPADDAGNAPCVYLNLCIPLEKETTVDESPPVRMMYVDDPVDTGIIGLTVGPAYTILDKKWGLADDFCRQITLGLYFTPRTSLRLNYTKGRLSQPGNTSQIYENYSLNAQYYLCKNRRIRPYATAGIGEQLWSKDLDQKTFQINAGIGLHGHLHRKVAVQAEWTHLFSFEEDCRDQLISASVIYRFGDGERSNY